jgi:hypothetical protein
MTLGNAAPHRVVQEMPTPRSRRTGTAPRCRSHSGNCAVKISRGRVGLGWIADRRQPRGERLGRAETSRPASMNKRRGSTPSCRSPPAETPVPLGETHATRLELPLRGTSLGPGRRYPLPRPGPSPNHRATRRNGRERYSGVSPVATREPAARRGGLPSRLSSRREILSDRRRRGRLKHPLWD